MSAISDNFGMTCSAPAHKATKCPPRMSDGRNFTDYRQTCAITSSINATVGRPLTSNEMRAFLTKHASDIMNQNLSAAQRTMGCEGTCYSLDCSGTMLPEQTMQHCGKRTCSFPTSEPMGLGLGREYGN